jgi:hypothetical protein
VSGLAGDEDVPEQRAVLDGAGADVHIGDQGAYSTDRIAGHRDATDPGPPLYRDDASGHGVQKGVALLRQTRDHQAHFAASEPSADPVEDPAAVLARGPDAEQLDHGRHHRLRSLRIDDGEVKFDAGENDSRLLGPVPPRPAAEPADAPDRRRPRPGSNRPRLRGGSREAQSPDRFSCAACWRRRAPRPCSTRRASGS